MIYFVLFLQEDPGYGTSDGTFGKKRYFTCPPKSAVFVTLHKLHPRKDFLERNLNNNLWRVTQLLTYGKKKGELPEERINQVLEIDQRVVAFIDGHPARGAVRYVGEERCGTEYVYTVVGLELVG